MYESFKFNKMSKEFRYVGLQEHEMANLCLHPTNFVPKGTGTHVHTSGTHPHGSGACSLQAVQGLTAVFF